MDFERLEKEPAEHLVGAVVYQLGEPVVVVGSTCLPELCGVVLDAACSYAGSPLLGSHMGSAAS